MSLGSDGGAAPIPDVKDKGGVVGGPSDEAGQNQSGDQGATGSSSNQDRQNQSGAGDGSGSTSDQPGSSQDAAILAPQPSQGAKSAGQNKG